MSNTKVTYKEIKAKQIADLKSKTARYMIYRKFSTPFTYAFVKLRFSPSTISILNFFSPIMGYFLLSGGTYFSIISGLLFFFIFKILDCCDGEVARIQNPKAMEGPHKNIEGIYFDAIGHFIFPICLGMGLGTGLYRLYGSELYILLGFFLSILFTLEVAVTNELVRSYFRKGIIERGISGKISDKDLHNRLMGKINEGRSWSDGNIFSRLFRIYPFQGLAYSVEFIIPILIFLTLIDNLIGPYIGIPVYAYGVYFGFVSIYLFVIAVFKTIRISEFVYRMKTRKYITTFLDEMQR